MCENRKTGVFLVIAAVAVLVAWASRPSLTVIAPEDMRRKPLFPQFTDALTATSLEIIKYDEKTATVQPFKVAQVGGRWSIPSHDNYPADAKDQLASVAADMVGLTVLDVASESPGDRALYGVVGPDLKTLKPGDTGVGTQVTMRDKDNKELMSLVIGGQVPDRSELHYVRRPGQDPIYTVAIQTSKLSTKFQDWIEDDLLKLNAWDLKKIQVQDYSVDELNGRIIQRGKMTLDYADTGEPKWTLSQDEEFQEAGGTWTARKLGADQELNTQKLEEMKTALDDLKIVDVARKPAGLSADLKAEKSFLNDPQARASLDNLGFYAAQVGSRFGIYSNEGEVRCLMKDGVEYVLRFGEIAAGTGSVDDDKPKEADKAAKSKTDEKGKADEQGKAAEEGGSGLNRYIFVMAEFNPAAIAKPEDQPVPPASAPPAEMKDEKAKPEAAAKKVDEKAEKAKADELAKKREEIQKENQRKKDEYNEAIRAGEKHVKELNQRFADWYYVIPDSVYRKIHLTRDEIVKKKEPKKDAGKQAGGGEAGGMTPVDFEKLKGGLEKPGE